MLDVVLIAVNAPHPANVHAASVFRVTPLGVASLGAALERASFRAALVDMNAPPCPSDWVVRFTAHNRPRLIGLSCATESAGNCLRLARRLRAALPQALIVAGGPHWTFLPEAALTGGDIDAVAVREGDATIVELAEAACGGGGLERIAGLVLPERGARGELGGVRRTAPRPLVADLDALPLPARHLFVPRERGDQASVLTGRGCPGRCAFCAAAAMAGGRRRARSPENVLAELVALSEAGATGVFFVDDTLTAEPPRLERLLDLMEEARLRLTWVCESRADTASRPLFARMAALGCASVQFGVESGCQELLDAMGKGTTLGQVEQAVAWAAAAGISPVCSFILGQPWDTPATIAASLEFAAGLQRRHLARCSFSVLVPFPGTRLWRHGERLGLRRLHEDFDRYTMHTPVCATASFGPEELRTWQYEAAARLADEVTEDLAAMLPFGPAAAGAGGAAAVWRDWY